MLLDCSEYLKSSLFLVGEIGGNEFFYGLTQGKTMEELRNMVPEVVQNIVEAVNVSYPMSLFLVLKRIYNKKEGEREREMRRRITTLISTSTKFGQKNKTLSFYFS